MDKLNHRDQIAYANLLDKLQIQLNDLNQRCAKLDQSIKQTENQCFVFEVHLFPKRSLTLTGYIKHLRKTYHSLCNAINKQLSEALIQHECERFVAQFQVLLKLVQGLEKGDAKLLYKSYSSLKEQIFQRLQKQYSYEHRLLTMISEQEELLTASNSSNNSYIKEKIAILKVRYQKCNTFTQKLEFQLEEIQDD
jgi:primosomal replication protein N''